MRLQIDLTVPSPPARWVLAGLLLALCAPDLGSESVTLNTFYPAPSGVYQYLVTTNATFLARDASAVNVGYTSANVSSPAKSVFIQGYLGVGTQRPDLNGGAKVDIADTGTVGLRYIKSGSKDARFMLGDNSGQNWSAAVGWATGGDFSIIQEGVAGNRLYINQNGNVGINTSSPIGGLHVSAAAGSSQRGYVHIDNANTSCSATTIVGTVGPNACASNQYITFQPGMYVEGFTYQDRGGQVIVETTSGIQGTQVWGLNPATGNAQWMTLYKNDASAVVWCCPKT